MIIEIERVGDMVVQQICKPDGSLVRYQYGKPGEEMKAAVSLAEACKAIAPIIGKTIDRAGDILVQKLTKNGECAGYRHGNEALGWTTVSTLVAARKAIGKVQA